MWETPDSRLGVKPEFVGHDGSCFISHRLDPGYREASVVQVGESPLESVVQIVCQRRGLFPRSQYTRIDAVLLAVPLIWAQHPLDPPRLRRHTALGLAQQPTPHTHSPPTHKS